MHMSVSLKYTQAMLDKEPVFNTATGNGVAIPHGVESMRFAQPALTTRAAWTPPAVSACADAAEAKKEKNF